MLVVTDDPTTTPTATPTAQPPTPSETPTATPTASPDATPVPTNSTDSLDAATFVDTMAGVTDHLVLLIWIGGIVLFLLAFLAIMAVRR